mgnify:CR=1 FL=1
MTDEQLAEAAAFNERQEIVEWLREEARLPENKDFANVLNFYALDIENQAHKHGEWVR